MPVKTLTTTVAGAQFKQQHLAVEEFWRRMEAANGGRPGDPRDYINLVNVEWDPGRGWIIEYEVPMEILEQGIKVEPEPALDEPVFESIDRELPAPVKDVLITGWNPRKAFDPEALQALAEDIRQNGLINAITVRPKGKSKYELVAGERRLRAFRLLGRATIPAKVRELTDEQVLDIMLAENLQRVDLNPIEEAHHLKRVLEVGKLTQTELGRRIGKSQEWVSQRLRLAEAPAVLQDLIISRQINTSSAIEILQWKNTEHYDAIMHEIGAWSVEGEELPRVRVREIIKEITEPEHLTREEEADVSVSLEDLKAGRSEVIPAEVSDAEFMKRITGDDDMQDLPFVNPEDCKDCDIYDRANNTCPEGCTNAEECEDCFCEVTDDDEGGCEMFGVPGAADDEVCAVDCPDYEECKSEGEAEEDDDEDLPEATDARFIERITRNIPKDDLMITERPEDFVGNKGVPEVLGKHDSRGYHGRLIGSPNGDLQVETGERKKPYYEDLGVIVAKAIGCVEGDRVPIAVDITRGTITIRRRGKF